MTENKALALAPLITPFAFTFYAYISNVPGFNMDDGILNFLGLFFGLSLAAIPVAYIYMFFIGGKFYGMIKRRRKVNKVFKSNESTCYLLRSVKWRIKINTPIPSQYIG